MVTHTRVSQTVVRGSELIDDQFPGDPRKRCSNGDFKVYLSHVKNNGEIFFNLRYVYFVRPFKYLIKYTLYPRIERQSFKPSKYEAQTALFKDPVRTAQ